MKKDIPSDHESGQLSPLDEIRKEEAQTATQVFLARQKAETALKSARQQASEIKQRAQQRGAQDGRAEYEKLVETARQEALEITTRAGNQSDALLADARPQVEPAAEWALLIILGLESGKEQP